MADEKTIEKIIALSKRRGFVYPSSEIYGGYASVYDYGPRGVELKNNIKKAWWQEMVHKRTNIVGLDSAIFMHPKTWQASGHVEGFTDPLVECKTCHHRFKANNQTACPDCGGELTTAKNFNLLVEAKMGVTDEAKSVAYLRGETCQGIYLNFQNVLNSTRQKIPFGIAQIGKAFRNEITPKNFIFRTREFEQMEMEFFIAPDKKEADKFFNYWKQERLNWYLNLGIDPKKLRFREHAEDERAHYAKSAEDIEYDTPFGGWKEFEGIHNRGDWDLSRHSEYCGKTQCYLEADGKKVIPWIIETSAGVDRAFLMFLLNSYKHDKNKNRVYLDLHKSLVPVQVAIFPLLGNKPELISKAKQIFDKLVKQGFVVEWDQRGNIGKRYYAQDEIGTPYCVTVDFDTLDTDKVTVRDRNTALQEKVDISKLDQYIK